MTYRLTISNRITLVRIFLTPLFALAVLYYVSGAQDGHENPWLRWVALLIFVTAGLSDALDGYLARTRNERTRLGTILDPLADKLLLLCALILLSGPWGRVFDPHIPIWYVWMVISRDSMLILGAAVIHTLAGHVEVRPRFSGKLSTLLQMVIIVWVLMQGPVRAFYGLLGAAAVATLLSAVLYLTDGVRQFEKVHPHEHPRTPGV